MTFAFVVVPTFLLANPLRDFNLFRPLTLSRLSPHCFDPPSPLEHLLILLITSLHLNGIFLLVRSLARIAPRRPDSSRFGSVFHMMMMEFALLRSTS
jgi:hypothetical protein